MTSTTGNTVEQPRQTMTSPKREPSEYINSQPTYGEAAERHKGRNQGDSNNENKNEKEQVRTDSPANDVNDLEDNKDQDKKEVESSESKSKAPNQSSETAAAAAAAAAASGLAAQSKGSEGGAKAVENASHMGSNNGGAAGTGTGAGGMPGVDLQTAGTPPITSQTMKEYMQQQNAQTDSDDDAHGDDEHEGEGDGDGERSRTHTRGQSQRKSQGQQGQGNDSRSQTQTQSTTRAGQTKTKKKEGSTDPALNQIDTDALTAANTAVNAQQWAQDPTASNTPSKSYAGIDTRPNSNSGSNFNSNSISNVNASSNAYVKSKSDASGATAGQSQSGKTSTARKVSSQSASSPTAAPNSKTGPAGSGPGLALRNSFGTGLGSAHPLLASFNATAGSDKALLNSVSSPTKTGAGPTGKSNTSTTGTGKFTSISSFNYNSNANSGITADTDSGLVPQVSGDKIAPGIGAAGGPGGLSLGPVRMTSSGNYQSIGAGAGAGAGAGTSGGAGPLAGGGNTNKASQISSQGHSTAGSGAGKTMIWNVHAPNHSFALTYKANESTDKVLARILKKAGFPEPQAGVGRSQTGPIIKYEYDGGRYSLEDDDDMSILLSRFTPGSTASVTLHIVPSSMYGNPSNSLFVPDPVNVDRPVKTAPRSTASAMSRSGAGGFKVHPPTGSIIDGTSVYGGGEWESLGDRKKREWTDFHANNGVRTVVGSVGGVHDVRMLLKGGYRHVYVSRAFAAKHGFIPKQSSMGTYGYVGLVNLGEMPITVGSVTAKHKVMLSEENNFDVVLGRSWMEKMGIKTDPVDPTSVTYMSNGETIPCDIVVLRDGNGEVITVT